MATHRVAVLFIGRIPLLPIDADSGIRQYYLCIVYGVVVAWFLEV